MTIRQASRFALAACGWVLMAAAGTAFGQGSLVLTADVDLPLDAPGGGINQLSLGLNANGSVTADLGFPLGTQTIPINASDSDSTTASGNLRCDLVLDINPVTYAATAQEITFKRSRVVLDNDPSFLLNLGSYLLVPLGTVDVNATDLVGSPGTPVPPGTVTGTAFPLAPHNFELYEGTITGAATGLAANYIAPINIDLAVAPLEGPLGSGNGALSVSFLSRNGLELSYAVQITAPVDFASLVVTNPVNVTVSAAGTVRATGVVTVNLCDVTTDAGTLFADSFDRADSTSSDGSDLNTSGTGKSGSLGALTWSGMIFEGVDVGGLLDINNNQMRINAAGNSGNNGGIAYISDHNFSDDAIRLAKEFTVSVDIAESSSGGDGRYPGFGIGQTLADITGMTGAEPQDGAADVFVAYDQFGGTQGIAIFHDGALQGHTGTPTAPQTMAARFTFSDMNAGTTLNYEVFLDGVSIVTGSTTWSGTKENYITLQSNTTGDTRFDNFEISVPVPLELKNFTFNPVTGDSEVSITGAACTSYRLVEASDLDFSTQDPVPILGATVGLKDGDEVITDGSGNATVQFNLGTGETRNYIRAETP